MAKIAQVTPKPNNYKIDDSMLQSIRSQLTVKNETLLAIGTLETEYMIRKTQLLAESAQATATLNSMIKSAAQAANVPLDSGKWNLDFTTMTFTQVG